MSADKPKSSGDSSDLAEVRQALSSKVWFQALDNRIRQYPRFFEFLWDWRFWWIAVAAFTFILPVLQNDNTATLSYSRSSNLFGFDLLFPMLSAWSNDNNVVHIRSFSVNPMALIIYGLAGLHLYLLFVKTPVSPRLTLWHGAIQTVLTILFPFLDITVLNWVLPGFNSYWHVQPPLVGFWFLLLSGVALWGAAYGRILRGLPVHEEPPPLH
jgi:hypothetical protein